MEITIQCHEGEEYKLTVSQTDTLLNMKEQFEEQQGIELQDLDQIYHQGYLLNDDNLVLGEFLRDSDELILVLPFSAPVQFKSNEDIWLVHGRSSRFKAHLVTKDDIFNIVLKSDYFGVVYKVEGVEIGSRVFHLKRYLASTGTKIVIENKNGRSQVTRDGHPLEHTDVKVYAERDVRSNWEKARIIRNFVPGISASLNEVHEETQRLDGLPSLNNHDAEVKKIIGNEAWDLLLQEVVLYRIKKEHMADVACFLGGSVGGNHKRRIEEGATLNKLEFRRVLSDWFGEDQGLNSLDRRTALIKLSEAFYNVDLYPLARDLKTIANNQEQSDLNQF